MSVAPRPAHADKIAPVMAIAAVLGLSACAGKPDRPVGAPTVGGAELNRGAALFASAGCGACHAVAGRRDAQGGVGPPLDRLAQRTTLAGVLPNTPRTLILWILEPQAVKPGNAMPDTGLSPTQARDVAAYLYSLGDG